MDKKEEIQEISNLKKYLLWIMDKRIYIFSVIISVVLLNLIIFKLKGGKSTDASTIATQNYTDWKNTFFKDNDKLNNLKSLIKKSPSLKANYEGLIVQNLLINENLNKDDYGIADKALERIKLDLPFYYDYSQIALVISNGKYEDALNKSKELKIKMLGNISTKSGKSLSMGSVLYSLNLLRIALLEQKLNNPSKELIAWTELEDYLNFNDNKIQTANTIKAIFSENEIELTDYIQYRKNKISSIKS